MYTVTAQTSLRYDPDPLTSVAPEQIDSWLYKQAARSGYRLVPRTGLGAVYCFYGRLRRIRPEILVAQGAQEVYFFTDHPRNYRWLKDNNPAEMKWYPGRFDPEDAPPELNRTGRFAIFVTKRQGIKAHFDLAEQYINRGYDTVQKFLNAWGTGRVATIVESANAILAEPRIGGMGVRSDFTGRAASQLASRGIVRGYSGGVMRTEWPLTRAEMATLLTRLFPERFEGLPYVAAPPDCVGHWAEPEIRKVAAAGVMVGFPDGTWHPDDPLTRAQTCAILYRVAAPSVISRGSRYFADVRPGDWHYDYVMWAWARGWLEEFTERDVRGQPRFLPDLPITRGEVFHLAYNLLLLTGQMQGANTGFMTGVQTGAQNRPRFVSAVWVGAQDLWIPRSVAAFMASEEETFELPYTVVPVEVARVPGERWLPVLVAAGIGAAAVGAGFYLARGSRGG